jgi:hypothetical protein
MYGRFRRERKSRFIAILRAARLRAVDNFVFLNFPAYPQAAG